MDKPILTNEPVVTWENIDLHIEAINKAAEDKEFRRACALSAMNGLLAGGRRSPDFTVKDAWLLADRMVAGEGKK